MFRLRTILAAVVALAVSAPPVASASSEEPVESTSFNMKAGPSKPPKAVGTRTSGWIVDHYDGGVGSDNGRRKGGLNGVVTNNNDPEKLGRVIESLGVKYT